MKTPTTWLLAGACFAVCAGATVAIAAGIDPADAARQAREDAQSAESVWRADRDADRADRDQDRADRDRARADRDRARADRDRARADRERDIVVIRGGDRGDTLSTMLQLRPDQEPALKTFLDATRSDRDNHDHMVRFDRGDDRTTLQRLDEMQARAAEQKAEMDRKVAAIKAFYGQLDGRQKQTFDAMPMLMMVGPNVGPMMIPRPMPIVHRIPPVPPVPPIPPVPPRS